jgi:leucine dehydrogenase
MDYVAMETDYVTGLGNTSGDPSPFTAMGVYYGMKAAAMEKWGSDSLEGKTVAVQGVGHVGYYLCKHLAEEGAKLIITDIKQDNIDHVLSEMEATVVGPDEIYGVDCDVFAPCALGAVINDNTIPQFKCEVICGASNNVLAEDRHGDKLEELNILYAPDYVVNAGGLINVYQEILGYDKDAATRKTQKIYDRVLELFELAKEENIPTYLAADRYAEKRIETIRNVRSNYIKR